MSGSAGTVAGAAATGPVPPTRPPEPDSLRPRFDRALAAFLDDRQALLASMSPDLAPAVAALREFAAGGKRLRALFCYWGARAAGGADDERLVTAAASLELLQAGALIHDDLIDASDTRRGRPSVHRRFAALHAGGGWAGASDRYGAAAAVLLGDLCLAWCDDMFDGCGLPPARIAAAKPLHHLMRTEVMAGQYLDVLTQARGLPQDDPVRGARAVITYKTAKYTVERPLHIGAALAGGDAALLGALTRYGLPLGEAFQLRDDLLGVFGDPATTGKPSGDDLREGKQTLIVALALRAASTADAARLRARLGAPELDDSGVAELAGIIGGSGAPAAVERRISRLTSDALAALDEVELPPAADGALRALATAATERAH